MTTISRYLKKLHTIIPVNIRNVYSPLLTVLQNIRMYFPKLYIIEGEEASSAKPMKLAYWGLDERVLQYWLDLLFSQYTILRAKSIFPIWIAKRKLTKNAIDCDLAMVELNNFTQKTFNNSKGFVLPRWLDLELNPSEPLKIKQLDTILRRIRKYKLTFERKLTDSDLLYFYERMYKPYISGRHKKAAIFTDFKQFQYLFNNNKSQLYFILKDGEPVAGAIDIIEGKNVRMGSIGVLDGRDDLLKMGVVGACYYYRIMDYRVRKINMVNVGGTSPILTDGLTQFKLSFGAEVADREHMTDPSYIMILPVNITVAVKNALKSNPFIYITKKSTHRAIFCDLENEDDKSDFLRILNFTDCGNTTETYVYCFNGENNNTDWFDYEHFKKVKFIDYKT
jgi:hypothetical protein